MKLKMGCSSGSVSFSISTWAGGMCMMLAGRDDWREWVGRPGGTASAWGVRDGTSAIEVVVSRRSRRETLLSGESGGDDGDGDDLEPMKFVKEADHARQWLVHFLFLFLSLSSMYV